WLDVGLNAGTAAIGVKLHTPYRNIWRLGSSRMENAAAIFFGILADIGSGPTTAFGNYNVSFNVFENITLDAGSYVGECLYVSGSGSPTVPVGIVTLNRF